jgi:hypothetical protein
LQPVGGVLHLVHVVQKCSLGRGQQILS